ncbi:ATP-dependent RNA helicase HrpA [Parasulfuritortus cantonensis]|uniref:ATP-dependent RNA helicase HrpA n=2 Tax=Parasulfuritortus cantonensis TaxID=2528202 RepID=A0A4R1BGP7_9PROT|nr:ATP-dependent RNA helicase HrpA [Parasulfuritortus cantonensis]
MAPQARIEFPEHLPVSARREDIAAALTGHQVVIVCGETGSGKTTQLPKIAWAAGRGRTGLIGMTQPRRIAAKSVASRLAEETATQLGGFVGWQVRFTDQVGRDSRIKVMTDGILLAETQSDPQFRAYDTLILDEAHERSLNIDFLLGYLKTLLGQRPDLKLIISSATLEADRFSAYFGAAPVVEVSGRTYPVEVRYRPPAETGKAAKDADKGRDEEEPDLEAALLMAVDELAREGTGDILVFLPGEREIRDVQEALRKHHPPHTEILPLFARLSVTEQEQIFKPHSGRRIVLATNVAETSLTVPGIRYVVDTGQARVKRYSIRNKIEQLKVEKVSQASANQRTGRCGRVAEGICIRLYDEQDFQSRPPYTTPELLRSSLAGVILRMKSLHLPEIGAFPFLDPPEPRRIHDGQALLRELNALAEDGRLTRIGRELARLPLDPRLGRMLVAAREKAVLHEVLVIAAFLSTQDPRDRPLERQAAADQKHARFADENSDFVAILKLWRHVEELNNHRKSQRKFRDALAEDFLSARRVREWREVYGQLTTQVKELGWKVADALPAVPTEEAGADAPAGYANLHQALLPGLLGNLGMLTEEGLYLGARETKFLPFPGSGVKKKPKWVMAAEIVETRRIYARTVARIEPDWIEHAARHLLKVSYSDPHWAKKPAHVAASLRATLYGLPVVNGRKVHYGPIDPVQAREIFIRAALVAGEYDTRAAFFGHNRKLLAQIDELSHRSRNARIAVDEEDLYRFFDDRIPEGIHNGAAFEKWLREAEVKSPKLLHLRREDLLRERGADARDFPKELDLGGVKFALAYRFDPGAEDDGVTLLVPLAALNQVPQGRCDWLVPGLLEEKALALIKGLPQSVRRAFVPVPEFARAAAEALRPGETPLTEALADFLAKTTGQAIARDAWRPEALPAHLTMNYRVLDERNHIVAEGRDLPALRRELGGEAARSLQQAAAPDERADLGRWDFGDLPGQVELTSGGRKIAAYPSLVEDAGQVALKLLDSPALAREQHRRGVCRLLWRAFPDLLKQVEKDLGVRLKPAAMQYALLGNAVAAPAAAGGKPQDGRGQTNLTLNQLLADVLYSAARAVLAVDPADLRRQNEFDSAAQTARPRLAEQARETARLAAECLEHGHRLNQQLARAPASKEAAADLRAQLPGLVFPGFVGRLAPAVLVHLPRYLKAMERRLEKLPGRPERDAQMMRSLTPLLGQWQARARREEQTTGLSPEMEAFRWQLEELRVSLFAQELKTPEPISVKRMEKRWAELIAR